ncbi:MAG: hypothetical protein CMO55_08105 [Verrucomicrobiales bacterium]|nr:hypothetical protein [Verrucomicrobiales bacterium]
MEHGRRNLINTYSATSPAEFFATDIDMFFESPNFLLEQHSALYEDFLDSARWNSVLWVLG